MYPLKLYIAEIIRSQIPNRKIILVTNNALISGSIVINYDAEISIPYSFKLVDSIGDSRMPLQMLNVNDISTQQLSDIRDFLNNDSILLKDVKFVYENSKPFGVYPFFFVNAQHVIAWCPMGLQLQGDIPFYFLDDIPDDDSSQ